METLLQQLENTTYIDPTYTESWLREFVDYIDRNQEYDDTLDISNEENFISTLEQVNMASRCYVIFM